MEADKMFEKIGYRNKTEIIENNNLTTIKYNKQNKYEIIFKTNTKETIIEGFKGIEIEELQAINKKCEELGWI